LEKDIYGLFRWCKWNLCWSRWFQWSKCWSII